MNQENYLIWGDAPIDFKLDTIYPELDLLLPLLVTVLETQEKVNGLMIIQIIMN